MTRETLPPQHTAAVTASDGAAYERIWSEYTQQLSTLRTRAATYVAALASITGVLGTVAVLSTGTRLEQLSRPWGVVAGVLVLLAAAAVVTGLVLVYDAATTTPWDAGRDTLEPYIATARVDGAAAAWTSAVTTAVGRARTSLTVALWVSVGAVALMAAALSLGWWGPTGGAATGTWCVQVGGTTLEVDAPPRLVDGTYEVVACG
ncbi:hypothetical protein [Cellulomonas shaoxiangyii]|uniref:Uncharacterized protein n=1 Tax=Cellulomonas shaoxiangyii TaxID=2566013 RepID=A0A4P7SKD5_9CELL|nr:hypothetical protein [Cellulomonas shaoxiangyii]QCB94662.1 hypothetical protein E5225_14950 [Cellulomonas shaoxiangyii]TGY84715.1 hypothetical protein E5226_09945 [Cellulomonas shaoxiangyii]